MSECILSNKELENATKLMKIAIEHFPIPKTYTKEEKYFNISVDRIRQAEMDNNI